MLNVRRQTAPQVIQFFCPLCEVTPRSAFVLRALRVAQRRATARMELSARFKILRDGTEQGAKRLSRQGSRGKDSIAANLPPHSDGKASAAQKRPTKRRRAATKGGCSER
jgi:hypothetical protein